MQNTSLRKRRNESRSVNRRAFVIFTILCFALLGLYARVAAIQITDHDAQKKVAVGNTIKSLYISPERGDVYDRNGQVIAGTRSKYDLVVIPEKIPNFHQSKDEAAREFFQVLNQFIELDESKIDSVVRKIMQARSYAEVVVKNDLADDELSTLLANTGLVDGITVRSRRVREYNYPNYYVTPLGYVGRVSPDDLARSKEHGYKLLSSDHTGKSGIEKIHDQTLYGSLGQETVALNSRGRIVERQIADKPLKGSGLGLTIDHRLQSKAYELLGDRKGSIIMVDVKTGEVLTMLSLPAMDVNKFVGGLSKDDARRIFAEGSGRPLFNRAIRGQYPPASTIKPFLALAAIEGEFVDPEEQVVSGANFSLGGLTFRDWKRWGHGKVDAPAAIAVSSDVYFYKIANKMGVDYIHDYLYEFGFGRKTGVDLEHEATGLLPSSEWKRAAKGLPWYAGETLNVGIGQGYFMSTPMQLTMATAMLVNGGKRMKPLTVLGEKPVVLSELNIDQNALAYVKQGMVDTIHSKKGTARAIKRMAEGKIAGKTGTSQVYSTNGIEKVKNKDLQEKLRDHAIFIGYAPYDSPEVVITVFIENGESGSRVAAPMAGTMLDYYMKLKGENSGA